jgi:stage IV sporulation protein FA
MDRIDEIKKRHSDRKQKGVKKTPYSSRPTAKDVYSTDYYNTAKRPQPSKDKPPYFLIKCMVAAVLVLGIGVIEKQNLFPSLKVKDTIKASLDNEFNFARVSSWYESAFGSPLSFLPLGRNQQVQKTSTTSANGTQHFAVPVSGQVTETFTQNKKGVTVQTAENSNVEAIDSGYVLSITNDKMTGKTVVVQHTNGDQSVYGKLKTVDVKPYDFVKKKQKIGTVSQKDSQGVFYFAIKEGDHYVDPIQVISFD